MAALNRIYIKSQFDDLTFFLPNDWASVTRKMLKRMAPILVTEHESIDAQQILLLHAVSGLNVKRFYEIVSDDNIDNFHHDMTAFDELINQVDFLSSIKFSNDIVGNIGIFPLNFKGIGDSLKHLTLDQWIFSGAYTDQYFNTKDPKEKKASLNRLFASLFSPGFLSWRKWMFKPLILVAHLLSHDLKLAILVNFIGIKAHFVAANPQLFSGGSGKQNNEELITQLAGSKFGLADKVGTKQARLVMVYLNKQIKDQARSKK